MVFKLYNLNIRLLDQVTRMSFRLYIRILFFFFRLVTTTPYMFGYLFLLGTAVNLTSADNI